jgi:aromatic-L-amino-acid/L-tryptophan decarboxylase
LFANILKITTTYTYMTDSNLPPLTLSQHQMQIIAHQVSELILEHFMNLNELPVTRPSVLEDLNKAIHEPVPTAATPFSEIITQLKSHVFSEMTHADHPRNLAFVPGPSNFISAMADSIASSFNVFCGGFLGPSGVAQLELTTIEWLCELLQFPKGSGGLFVSGGSAANMMSLAVARNVMLGNNITNATAYFSDQTHSSVAKGLRILGFQPHQIRKIPSDEKYRLPMEALRQYIAADRLKGLVPFCVIANAGTTNAGAIDPLPELSAYCRSEKLWLHVDGAFGGAAAITQRGRNLLQGIELADSLGIDPHKWLFQPYEIGCVLVRNQEHLKSTFKVSAEYLKIIEQSTEQINFWDYGMQLTRGFRALKLWLSFKAFGVDEFRKAIMVGIENAEYVESLLRNEPCWEIVTPAQLGIITFRYIKNGMNESELNNLNNRIIAEMIASGYALLSPTVIGEKHVLRMCIINPRTTHDDLNHTVELLQEFGYNLAI